MGGRPSQDKFQFAADGYLYLYGGTIVIDAGGDGLDSNGPIKMTGGILIIHGPTSNNNGALDYMGAFKMTGGFLVAAGSSGMAQAPSGSSTQYSVMVYFPSTLAAGTMVHVESEDGEGILTFAPAKAYQSLVFCSPDLRKGTTYQVYAGGSSTGTASDGLYNGGTYSGGAGMTSFTISSIVTGAGSYRGSFPGDPAGNRGQPGGHRPWGRREAGQPRGGRFFAAMRQIISALAPQAPSSATRQSAN